MVTGGGGFIGSHLVEKLLSEGFDVRILGLTLRKDNVKNLLQNPHVEFIKGNICDLDVCKKAVNGCEIVSHLAALISKDHGIERGRRESHRRMKGKGI